MSRCLLARDVSPQLASIKARAVEKAVLGPWPVAVIGRDCAAFDLEIRLRQLSGEIANRVSVKIWAIGVFGNVRGVVSVFERAPPNHLGVKPERVTLPRERRLVLKDNEKVVQRDRLARRFIGISND